MHQQNASTLLMIRPAAFAYNAETATNNAYQHAPLADEISRIQQKALTEFDSFADKLKEAGVNLLIMDDTPEPAKPDAVFPNNWISFHEDGNLVLYPMFAPSRRAERRNDIIGLLKEKHSYSFTKTIDLTHHELNNNFLEGTGSLVFDRVNKIAYASVSPRTSPELVKEACRQLNYTPIIFHTSVNGNAVYHTNVVLSVCYKFVIVCLDCINSKSGKQELINIFKNTGKEVLSITIEQVNKFAGNVFEVISAKGENLLIMSTAAFNSFDKSQLLVIERYCRIIRSSLDTIEKYGGGSARCMLAEIPG